MAKNKKEDIKDEKTINEEVNPQDNIESQEENQTQDQEDKETVEESTDTESGNETETDKVESLGNQLQKLRDQHLRLQAEFDNYRKRTLKEKMDLSKNAGESILMKVLPVMDDFERALEHMERNEHTENIMEGVELIHKKFTEFLNQNGVKSMDSKGNAFDTDLHEAITKIPVPEDDQKGKVFDVVQKGYTMNDKVIRFAKVVVGE